MAKYDNIDPQLKDELMEIVAEEGMVDLENLKLDQKLADLQIASADIVMILMAIEEKYDVYVSVDNELNDVETVGDVLAVMSKKINEQREKAET